MNDKYNEVKKIVAELDENYYLKLDAVIDEHINGEIHEIRKIINAEDFNYNKRFFKVNPSDTNTVLASANSGFYMIFTDYEYNEFVKKIDEENNINQTGQLHNQPLYLNVAELSLYCVYRGHSSNTKNRIQSHFL